MPDVSIAALRQAPAADATPHFIRHEFDFPQTALQMVKNADGAGFPADAALRHACLCLRALAHQLISRHFDSDAEHAFRDISSCFPDAALLATTIIQPVALPSGLPIAP
jgi:hypothetical protein